MAHVHDWEVCGGAADDPVAPDRVDLEECGEEEGYQPGDHDGEHDFYDGGEAPDGEDAGVEVEDRELDEGDGEDVEELQGEEGLLF